MKLTSWAFVLAMALGCGATTGDHDGRCAPNVPGDYRCIGNKVELCEAMDNPAKNPPQWYVVQDCQDAVSPTCSRPSPVAVTPGVLPIPSISVT